MPRIVVAKETRIRPFLFFSVNIYKHNDVIVFSYSTSCSYIRFSPILFLFDVLQ